MAGVGLVIFDNDGVVVDSELLANQVLSSLLTEHGHPTTVEECIRDYMGGTLGAVRSAVHDRSGRALPADFDDRYHRDLFDAATTELRAVPGVEDVLAGLDLPYCLASSGSMDWIVRSLSVTGLLARFENRIYSADQVAAGKPAPDLFLLAATSMGVAPSRCVVVEDSAKGVAAARAARMTVLGYAGLTPAARLAEADVVFERMDELPALLGRLGTG